MPTSMTFFLLDAALRRREGSCCLRRQFATMIDSGLPLVQCLDIQATNVENPTFKAQLNDIKETVEGGATFADALKKYPKTFDSLYVNLVAAGGVGGILDTILNRLASYIEKNSKLKRKVKGAMVYPIAILVIMFAILAVIMTFVVPVFEKMFSEVGAELPVPTQILITVSDFSVNYAVHASVGLAVFVFAFRAAMRNETGQRLRDVALLRLPMFGDLLKKVAVARFCRTLGTMIGASRSSMPSRSAPRRRVTTLSRRRSSRLATRLLKVVRSPNPLRSRVCSLRWFVR